jgi:hypothetical protein
MMKMMKSPTDKVRLSSYKSRIEKGVCHLVSSNMIMLVNDKRVWAWDILLFVQKITYLDLCPTPIDEQFDTGDITAVRLLQPPADQAEISIYITNTRFTSLYISDILIQFDYAIYTLSKTANRIIAPQTNAFLGKHLLPLPGQ